MTLITPYDTIRRRIGGEYTIENHIMKPEYAISRNLIELSRAELCELVAEIARQLAAEVGSDRYHGGVYPENISRSPEGEIAVGPAKRSDWSEAELNYIAPEIYWNNRPCPQSDVYALGLILYYGASGGRLPFEASNNNAQLMRMSGKTIRAPSAAGTQLGNIIEKALRFRENDRYKNPEEMAIMLDYCEDRRLMDRGSGALFNKEEQELSELEQIMVSIIEGKEERTPGTEERDENLENLRTEDEVFTAAGMSRPQPVKKEKEKPNLEEIFGLDEPDPMDQRELEMEENIRVYEPGANRVNPISTEADDSNLAPVTPNRKNTAVKVKTTKKQPVQEEEEEPQKRRPFLVVVLLLAVLLIAAVVAKILISAFSDAPSYSVTDVVQQSSSTAQPDATDFNVGNILSEEQIQYQQQLEEQARAAEEARLEAERQAMIQQAEQTVDPATLPHTYEAIKADLSWTQARDDALARGGYLVTINTEEEFRTVTQLADQAGFDRIWIGGHRENGEIVWESGESTVYYNWAAGEPSYTDSGDGAAEDYLMLWKFNGAWCYNDSRENPLTDFYGMYAGRLGYVIERVG